MFKAVRGTKDILPPDTSAWQEIESISRRVFALYDYQEIRTPIIEDSGLFNRSLGSSTEIIQKQMFTIQRDNDIFALRPEATACVARSYIENDLDKKDGFVKLYYIGAMFRAERPQKGRLRQFHHIGVEAIGSLSPYLDIEVISLADRLLRELGIKDFTVNLNSLGCAEDKNNLAVSLRFKLKSKADKLCEDCQERFKNNVFRILDCKNEICRKAVEELGLQDEHLCGDCKEHFLKVKSGLDALGVNYKVLPHLVRGLDYYTRTVFEVTHGSLGSQDAVGAGGRYDNLISELGGPMLGAMGFALGQERLLLARPAAAQGTKPGFIYVVTLGETAKQEGVILVDGLRKAGINCDTDYEDKSLKAQMRQANNLNAGFVLIIGEDELKKRVVIIKDMSTSTQEEVPQEKIVDTLKEKLKC
jgi:histidyl-tRNA synthetase